MAPGRRRPLLLNQTDFRLLQFSKLSRRYIVRGHSEVKKTLKNLFMLQRFYKLFDIILPVNFFHKFQLNTEKTEKLKCDCVRDCDCELQFCEFKVSSVGKCTYKVALLICTSWPIKFTELSPLCKIDTH
jgi:hypothetical protein